MSTKRDWQEVDRAKKDRLRYVREIIRMDSIGYSHLPRPSLGELIASFGKGLYLKGIGSVICVFRQRRKHEPILPKRFRKTLKEALRLDWKLTQLDLLHAFDEQEEK